MSRPPVPPMTHCRQCGAKLEIGKIRRRWVGGLFGNKQWQTSVACPQCGYSGGYGWTTFGFHQPPRNPILRFLAGFGGYLRRLAIRRQRRPTRFGTPFGDRPGHVSLAKLVEAAAFPVYGLRGTPAGLRLRSPGYSGGGPGPQHTALTGVEFLYVRGPAFEPSAGLRLVQGPRGDFTGGATPTAGALSALRMIEGLVRETATAQQRREWFTQGNFHQEWNVRRAEEATAFTASAEVGNRPTDMEVRSWPDARLFIARLKLDGAPMLVASIGLEWAEVLQAIGALTVLGTDEQALAEHQEAFEAAMEELRFRHS